MTRRRRALVVLAVAGLAGREAVVAARTPTIGSDGKVTREPVAAEVTATVTSTALAPGAPCTGGFVAHPLPGGRAERDVESLGSGVAADDLDGDGRDDLVLGAALGPTTVLWNEGAWRFTTATVAPDGARAVQLVDLDGDGDLDITTANGTDGVHLARNEGGRRFGPPEQVADVPAHVLAWGDPDGDGDLDGISGTNSSGADPPDRDDVGTFLLLAEGGTHRPVRLDRSPYALAAMVVDVDRDGADDILVGNDYEVPDRVWSWSGPTAQPRALSPFPQTSLYTMGYDAGDVDGDGVEELFSTDLRPRALAIQSLSAGLGGLAVRAPGQRSANGLQVATGKGRFENRARQAGVDASDWSWSGRFGDLDADGDLDLYVVNGWRAGAQYGTLGDIRFANALFRNDGAGRFRPATLGLEATESGRGSTHVDLDADGRLDVVVNNLVDGDVAYENRVCGGRAVEVQLHHPGTANTAAIGARVDLHLDGKVLVRYVRSGAGYLSGSPRTLHVGIGERRRVERAEVRWPDGRVSSIGPLEGGRRYEVER